ncbi:nuclear transport factor 2 family protein [Streptomyces sp. HPF1205]|uniref:nuclear transport factor 2 family protein n=1 Tax=Streptomyces sp. HPF1205 TaxID=2873262 RepID=UPI001CED7DDC|nr:nuclear transport factor 2 family protein [Streptomyces sp. HPF1205]
MKPRPTRAMTTLICTAAAVTAIGTTAFAAPPADRHLPEAVAGWSAAWNGTDPGALGALFTTDGTYTDQAIGVTFHGRQEIAGWKARTDSLIDGVHVTVRATHRDGDHITATATTSPSRPSTPAISRARPSRSPCHWPPS